MLPMLHITTVLHIHNPHWSLIYSTADSHYCLIEVFWLISINIVPSTSNCYYINGGFWSQCLYLFTGDAIYARACSINHCDGDVLLNLIHPQKHWLLSPTERNGHILESRFTTWSLCIAVINVFCDSIFIFTYRENFCLKSGLNR